MRVRFAGRHRGRVRRRLRHMRCANLLAPYDGALNLGPSQTSPSVPSFGPRAQRPKARLLDNWGFRWESRRTTPKPHEFSLAARARMYARESNSVMSDTV